MPSSRASTLPARVRPRFSRIAGSRESIVGWRIVPGWLSTCLRYAAISVRALVPYVSFMRLMIDKTAGPRITINSDGIMKITRKGSILIGALRAWVSAA
jgi:hypothetical protein